MRQELPIAAEVRPAIDLRAEKIAIDKNLAEERKSGSDSVEAAANAGERFERVANGLKPLGKWIAWLKANGYERRTATNRIIIHKNRAKWESFSHLGVSGVPKSLRVGKEEPEESNEEDDVAEEEIVAQNRRGTYPSTSS